MMETTIMKRRKQQRHQNLFWTRTLVFLMFTTIFIWNVGFIVKNVSLIGHFDFWYGGGGAAGGGGDDAVVVTTITTTTTVTNIGGSPGDTTNSDTGGGGGGGGKRQGGLNNKNGNEDDPTNTTDAAATATAAARTPMDKSPRGRAAAVIYIAGRKAGATRGEATYLVHELHLSIVSACRATAAAASGGGVLHREAEEEEPLTFVIFVSQADYDACSGGGSSSISSKTRHASCDFAIIEDSCHAAFSPTTTSTTTTKKSTPGNDNDDNTTNAASNTTNTAAVLFEYREMNDSILDLWETNTGVVEFSHHSTWYGYTKVWFPILLTEDKFTTNGSLNNKYEAALFVDTDIVWNKPPSVLFDDLEKFDSNQAIGALSLSDPRGEQLLRRPKQQQQQQGGGGGSSGVVSSSCGTVNRINSGVVLMDLKKLATLDWRNIVRTSVTGNRGGVETGVTIPDNYTSSAFCAESCKTASLEYHLCLTTPIPRGKEANKYSDKNCSISHSCWNAHAGDQEFLSDILSPPHYPELYYQLTGHQYFPQLVGDMMEEGFARTYKRRKIENDTLFHIPMMMRAFDPNMTLERIDSIFPTQTSDTFRWFRNNVDTTTRHIPPTTTAAAARSRTRRR